MIIKTSKVLRVHTREMETETEEQVRRILQLPKEKKKKRKRKRKKQQICERQTVPCWSVGLQSDLQSPCHKHSSETPLTSHSEHPWGRHLVESTNIFVKKKKERKKKEKKKEKAWQQWRYKQDGDMNEAPANLKKKTSRLVEQWRCLSTDMFLGLTNPH